MTATNNLESTRSLGSLKKVATRTVLAGGLSLALLGLGAGAANAAPATCGALPRGQQSQIQQQQQSSCPKYEDAWSNVLKKFQDTQGGILPNLKP
jgi:hypothetical protein